MLRTQQYFAKTKMRGNSWDQEARGTTYGNEAGPSAIYGHVAYLLHFDFLFPYQVCP